MEYSRNDFERMMDENSEALNDAFKNTEETLYERANVQEQSEGVDSETNDADFDELLTQIDELLTEETDCLVDGLSKRIEFEAEQLESGRNMLSVFEQEGLCFDNSVFESLKKFDLIPRISSDDTTILFEKLSAGEVDVKEKIIESNQMLVAIVAKEYVKSDFDGLLDVRKLGKNFDDLMAIGNSGLLKAIDKFDYTKDYFFSSYAVWWINQTICREIVKLFAEHLHTTVYNIESASRVYACKRHLFSELERKPTIMEIKEKMYPNSDAVVTMSNRFLTLMGTISKIQSIDLSKN